MIRRGRRSVVAALILSAAALVPAFVAGGVRATPGPPPPTPVNGTLSPFPSVLHTPDDARARPEISASSAMLVDLETGTVLFRKGSGDRRPIASVTKVLSALVVLARADLRDVVTIPSDAVFERGQYGATSTIGLRTGERQNVRDLLFAALLGSANDAARALAIHVAGSEDAFVRLMNRRAHDLGMRATRFFSATGLDDRGRSTAADLIRLGRAAMGDTRFARIVRARFHRLPGPTARDRVVQNRNVLLWLYPGALGVKTGSTANAGYCLMGLAEREGRRLLVVVLHAPTDAFSDAAALLNYGFDGFARTSLVDTGESLGSVQVVGGTVSVAAGDSLVGLVPVGAVDGVRRVLVVDDGVSFPPAVGETIGVVRITVPGLTVGRVPLVVSEVPPPPDPGDAPWWMRAAGSVARSIGSVVGALFD